MKYKTFGPCGPELICHFANKFLHQNCVRVFVYAVKVQNVKIFKIDNFKMPDAPKIDPCGPELFWHLPNKYQGVKR